MVSNCYWYIYNFRIDLIKLLKNKGYKVIVIAPKDEYKTLVNNYVDEVKDWNLKRGSINPLWEIRSIIQLIFLYKEISPK